MNVLFVASEATPAIKSGGLADVIGALPKALSVLGVDARIILPQYHALDSKLVSQAKVIDDYVAQFGQQQVHVAIRQTVLPDTSTPLYLVGLSQGLSLKELYPTRQQGDQHRFAFFSQAVLDWLHRSDWQPEIIHCHDWMASLIPLLVKQSDLKYKTLLTIHNIAYQGEFHRDVVEAAGVNVPGTSQKVNFLKTGIEFADKINTVSPTYASEVLTRPYGFGLSAALKHRRPSFSGILNGIDYRRYAPYADDQIAFDYNLASAIEAKRQNKRRLQQCLKLPINNQPLFGMVCRMDKQKGIDLVIEAAQDSQWLEQSQLVILGEGSVEIERRLNRLQKKYPNQLALKFDFDEELAHQIYAGSDFFTIPSRYEPCGLTQMIAMKYGTLPIVRRTGGLADTVVDISQTSGTGIVFEDQSSQQLLKAINRALELYRQPPVFNRTIQQAMRQNFSWPESAKKYLELYQKLEKPQRSSRPQKLA